MCVGGITGVENNHAISINDYVEQLYIYIYIFIILQIIGEVIPLPPLPKGNKTAVFPNCQMTEVARAVHHIHFYKANLLSIAGQM